MKKNLQKKETAKLEINDKDPVPVRLEARIL